MSEAVTANTNVHVNYSSDNLGFNDIIKVKSRVISITPNDTTSVGSLTHSNYYSALLYMY